MTYDLGPRTRHHHDPRSAAYDESTSAGSPGARHAATSDAVGSAAVPYTVTAPPGGLRGQAWPLLADDMFRLAHRDSTGAPLLDAHVAGLGLSAALLGELLLTGHVTVRNGLVVVADGAAPSDVLAHSVLDQLVKETGEHPVRTWLAYLGRGAYEDVAGRLERAGHLQAEVSRRLFGRTVRYVPTDMNAAAWPWARLAGLLRRHAQLDDFDILLGGLAIATDLHRVVLIGEANAFAATIQPLIAEAADPIRELLTHTRAAAGDAVITKT
ncbi:GPP34 family phosphoprotein [Couchioplanes caeruleus]|uniref:GOLPH3/VPS74 family protein n=1 Tax=Couchioplanes caeruleus TaxID=56438 RepID=UPI0020C1845D|nr:GPP34 family phosphoprotein [Couchioplanes caeruleus]UQU66823.1 GPP34 family phosphoprotein [Couchioplanes caeruleus]